jgi:hypothetical protein
MTDFSPPLTGGSSHNCFEGAAERSLVRKPRLKCRFGEGALGGRKQCFRSFDPLQNQVLVRRAAKGSPERSREMTDRKVTFSCQRREPH